MPEIYDDVGDAQYIHLSLARHEVAKLGCDHAQVGGWLLKSWNMPEFVVSAAHHSHDEGVPQDLLVACVIVASEARGGDLGRRIEVR